MATQAQITINAVIGSDDDLPIDTLVQLDNNNLGDETTFLWEILDQPPGAVDALSSTTIQNPTFTPKKEGSYLVKLTVNLGAGDEKTDMVIAAVRQLKTRERIPAAGETIEADTADGWATAQNSMLRRIDTLLTDSGKFVGSNTHGGVLTKGDVVRVTSTATIKAGLPGEEKIAGLVKAPATLVSNIDELLSVVEGDVDGNTTVPNGELVVARFLGRTADLPITGGSVGDPVFVSDTATISLTPGTARRACGSIIDVGVGISDVLFDGITIGPNVGSAPPVDVDKSAAAAGASTDAARIDHKHDISTATAVILDSASASAEGASTALARADHTHEISETGAVTTLQPDDGPTKGTSLGFARVDHNHGIVADAPAQGIGGGNAEGSGTSFARNDHDHTIRTTDGPTDLTVAAIPNEEYVRRSGSTLEGAGVFGQNSQTVENVISAANATSIFANYLSLVTPSIPAGTYRIGWFAVGNNSDVANDWDLQVSEGANNLIDPTVTGFMREEPSDSGSDQRHVRSGFRYLVLGAGVHTIDMDFRNSAGTDTVTMFHGVLEIWRVA